ncbi:Rne/Rng family ribonuclease [Candidatus Finniella inopinata]|uniref:Ribonuclease G n=1 Tax=Candidatus Finniella inopinata TaxID=1696036 RepID=A0A4Q7DJZ6_9PROT|nr:ribonuclease E/G [Candidatus Finniella inopinata]RZI46609.1 ribonuclease E/G [Candidatus Finniella inopinata]
MAKKLLIDANHPEEVRVAVVNGQILEDFDSETSTKKQIKGNIYLAKVVRVEPSLQAAFVEFGGNRHGFLPFSEIHPDYYRVPVADRPAAESGLENDEENIDDTLFGSEQEESLDEEADAVSEPDENASEKDSSADSEDTEKVSQKPKPSRTAGYRYKIQEVIKRRHIMLVQVVKEERGNKGASLTTYLSLPGRYCVLMPNAGYRAGGVSRKINDGEDRRRLKDLVKDLSMPEGMALIVRTAGQERNKNEIRRDYDYLLRLWSEIRDLTLQSIAPFLVYAEGDLIKKSIRDIYNRDIDEILVQGEEAYKQAKAFMRQLIPSHARKVKLYQDENSPLLHRFKVEEQINQMMQPSVRLPSGGSIVINLTEALVAIDVNSGRSTRERHIDDTALKTNLEAVDEVARQMRLRDLAGLVVIDFIDMSDNNHIQQVEKKLKEVVKTDRARIQLGKISQFGLMELSRQRLRPSLIETYTIPCTHCHGTGLVRSIESMSLHVLRAVETCALQQSAKEILLTVPSGVDLYLLNQKRQNLIALENRFSVSIQVNRDPALNSPDFKLDVLAIQETLKKIVPDVKSKPLLAKPEIMEEDEDEKEPTSQGRDEEEAAATKSRNNRRRQRRRRSAAERQQNVEPASTQSPIQPQVAAVISDLPAQPKTEGEVRPPSKNRRPRRRRPATNKTIATVAEDSTQPSTVKGNQPSSQVIDIEGLPANVDQGDTTKSTTSKKGNRGWLRRLLDS